MRRPHVYERSAPRQPRSPYHEPPGDVAVHAREIAGALPSLLAKAEGAGLRALADLIGRALAEADLMSRPRPPTDLRHAVRPEELRVGPDVEGLIHALDAATGRQPL